MQSHFMPTVTAFQSPPTRRRPRGRFSWIRPSSASYRSTATSITCPTSGSLLSHCRRGTMPLARMPISTKTLSASMAWMVPFSRLPSSRSSSDSIRSGAASSFSPSMLETAWAARSSSLASSLARAASISASRSASRSSSGGRSTGGAAACWVFGGGSGDSVCDLATSAATSASFSSTVGSPSTWVATGLVLEGIARADSPPVGFSFGRFCSVLSAAGDSGC